ncbi:MAG: FIST N-terminal domain-containing protein [Gemmatimonadaceae bacterium]
MQVLQSHSAGIPTEAMLAPLAAINPHLVLVFGGVEPFAAPDLLPLLRRMFPEAALAGCTTAGEICAERVADGGLVVSAVHFDHPGVRVETTTLTAMSDSADAGERLARQLLDPALHNVIVLGQGVQINGSALIEGFARVLPPTVLLSGGLAGDAGAFEETATLSRESISSRQLVAIGFYDPHLEVRHGSFHGWQPFGPARKVTRSEGNVLFELDGAPALDVYKRYLGEYAKELPGSGLLFPFEMLGADHHALGLIRTILGVDEASGSLILAGDIEQDGFLRLMHATTDSLVDGAHEAAVAVNIASAAPGESLALLISCVGRKLVMGSRVEEEVEAVSDVFGRHTRVTGFYSYGEISPVLGGQLACHLHNQTMTITHLSERAH